VFITPSVSFPLFRKHVKLLKAGKSLGEVLRLESEGKLHPDLKGGGYDALVTRGVITREEVLYPALLSAIIRSLRDRRIYYDL